MNFLGDLDDTVTILNPVAATIGALLKDHQFWIPGANGYLLMIKEKLFVTKKVREIIFDGFHDPLFDNLENIIHDLPFIEPLIPPGSLMDKFGFFYGRNGTDYTDGVWNMFTGAGDNSRMGKVGSIFHPPDSISNIFYPMFRCTPGTTLTLGGGPRAVAR